MPAAVPADSYAEWVRRTVKRVRAEAGRVVTLFDSSVREPTAFLSETIAAAFAAPVTSRYTSAFSGGNPFVVAHLAGHYGVDADHILCTTGATGALALLYAALVGPGERIIVETPGFDLFHGIAASQGIAVDHVERRAPDFALDVDAVAAAIRPETRLVVVSNLHNPSGAVIAHSAMIALARLAEARGVLVIVDEVYGDYADEAARPCAAAALSPSLISISSLTKIYGLSTLRCGWIVADPQLLAPVRRWSDRYEFGVSNLSHAVAALVLEEPGRFADFSRHAIAAARPMLEERFARWRGERLIDGAVPPFGCIAFPRLVGIADTMAFADRLSERFGVIVAPGEYFGAPGHVRIGFAQPLDDLLYGLDAIEEVLRGWPQATVARLTSAA